MAKCMQPRLFQNIHLKHSPEKTTKDHFQKAKVVAKSMKCSNHFLMGHHIMTVY